MSTLERRVDPWMGKFILSAERLILINGLLSKLPMHAMGLCLLGDGVHKVFNKHRVWFFLEANGPKLK
jgi:hypothetical protein